MAAGKKEDAQEEAAIAAAAAAKQKKKKLFLFIGLAVLLVILSVGSTVVAVKMLSSNSDTDDEDASELVDEELSEPVLPTIYYPLKPNFTVNYDVNGRQRFLQAELTLMYRDETLVKTLELHMPAVRNGLVMLLSNQTFDELQTQEGKEKLRADALKTIQDIITKERTAATNVDKDDDEEEKPAEKAKGKSKEKPKKAEPNIEQVLFTNFVMQ